MPENPYAPPSAEVADIAREETPVERPLLVTIGIWLLWLDIVISLPEPLFQIFDPPADESASSHYGKLLFVFVVLGFLALLTYRAGQGRNWARIGHLLLLILGVLAAVGSYVMIRRMLPEQDFQFFEFERPLDAALFVLNHVLSFAAVGMLFTPAANDWYRAVRDTAARKS